MCAMCDYSVNQHCNSYCNYLWADLDVWAQSGM